MVKRLGFILAVLAFLGLAGCSAQNPRSTDATAAQATGFKIGIMTGTVSQNEEEFRAGQQVAQKYGDRIKHVTYPDNFMQEQETTVSQILEMARDRSVRAIIVAQAVPGTIPAIKRVRRERDDVLFRNQEEEPGRRVRRGRNEHGDRPPRPLARQRPSGGAGDEAETVEPSSRVLDHRHLLERAVAGDEELHQLLDRLLDPAHDGHPFDRGLGPLEEPAAERGAREPHEPHQRRRRDRAQHGHHDGDGLPRDERSQQGMGDREEERVHHPPQEPEHVERQEGRHDDDQARQEVPAQAHPEAPAAARGRTPLPGHTTGRNQKGQYNGSMTMDDVFDMWAQIAAQGFVPDTCWSTPWPGSCGSRTRCCAPLRCRTAAAAWAAAR